MRLRIAGLLFILTIAAAGTGACGVSISDPAPSSPQRELSISTAISLVAESICPGRPAIAASSFRAGFLVETWAVTGSGLFEGARFTVVDKTAQVRAESDVARAMLEGDPSALPSLCSGTPLQFPSVLP